MRFERRIILGAFSIACLAGTPTAATGQREQLVITKLPDPDPNFVPPTEPKQEKRATAAKQDETLEGAMENVGRAIGQATLAARQQLDARCKETAPADATPEQRFALEAACRYQRH